MQKCAKFACADTLNIFTFLYLDQVILWMNFYGVTIHMKPFWQNLFDSAIYFFGFNSLLFARELRGRKPILLRDYLLSLDLSPA